MYSTEGGVAVQRSDSELLAALDAAERASRTAVAETVELLAEVVERGLHLEDGHHSGANLLAARTRMSLRRAKRTQRYGIMFAGLDEVAKCFDAGELSLDHVDAFLAAWSNPRVRDALVDSQSFLLDRARVFDAETFRDLIRGWIDRADPDGPLRRDEVSHERRDVFIEETLDGIFRLRGQFGPEQGAVIKAGLDRFADAERLADWDTARQQHGDDATAAHLERTEAQRRADALVHLVETAGTAPVDGIAPEPLVNIVVDLETFEAGCSGDTDRLDPGDPAASCRTRDGTPLTPASVAAAALSGRIRRVVLDGAGVLIDAGRARHFPRAVRDIVRTLHTSCIWPGCHVPSRLCHLDHVHEHAQGGDSDAANAAPLCSRHNRWRTPHRYRPRREPDGTWTIRRPDGTVV